MTSPKPIHLKEEAFLADPQGLVTDGGDLLAFSPGNMGSSVISQFRKEEQAGVPLHTSWTFWLDKTVRNSTAAEYKANLKKIYSVTTAQGFWSVYHHIPGVEELPIRYYYHLMREKREPLWEDPVLCHGGVWRLKCLKKDSPRVWKELLLAAIGEQFMEDLEEGDDICGLSVSPREKDDLIQVWNLKAAIKDQPNDKILQKIHRLLPDVRFLAEFYKSHQTHSAFEGPRPKK